MLTRILQMHSRLILVILFVAMFAGSVFSIFVFRQETLRQSAEAKDNLLFFVSQYEREVIKSRMILSNAVRTRGNQKGFYLFLDQLDILWSRVNALEKGVLGAEFMLLADGEETIILAFEKLKAIDETIADKKILSLIDAEIIERRLAALAKSSHSITLKAMQLQQQQSLARRDRLGEAFSITIVFGIFALMVGSTIIIMFFTQNKSLTNLRNNLENLVSERTEDLLTTNADLKQEAMERERVELELRDSRQQAEQANRAKSQFLANMSHELRTPLNAIIGFTDIMNNELMGPLNNEKYKGYVQDIHLSGNHLSDLLKDILDLTKIEANEVDVFPAQHSLKTSVTDALTLLEGLRSKFEHSVEIEIPDNLEILADPILIKQIIINLVSNSFKYAGQKKHIQIRTEIKNNLRVIVSDNGAGIPEDECIKILEPFHQYRENIEISDYKQSSSGTGIGLSISKRLAELHDGNLVIKSRLNENTDAILSLPLSVVRIV